MKRTNINDIDKRYTNTNVNTHTQTKRISHWKTQKKVSVSLLNTSGFRRELMLESEFGTFSGSKGSHLFNLDQGDFLVVPGRTPSKVTPFLVHVPGVKTDEPRNNNKNTYQPRSP